MTIPSPDRPPIVLVSRAFVHNPSTNQYLIIQRAKTDTNQPGKWEVPGGKLEKNQDLTRAMQTEVWEETGLVVFPRTALATYQDGLITEGRYNGYFYLVCFGLTTLAHGTVKLSAEHDDFRWVSYREMLTYDLTPETEKAAVVLAHLLQEPDQ